MDVKLNNLQDTKSWARHIKWVLAWFSLLWAVFERKSLQVVHCNTTHFRTEREKSLQQKCIYCSLCVRNGFHPAMSQSLVLYIVTWKPGKWGLQKLRRQSSYIPIGLRRHCYNDIRFTSLVKISFTIFHIHRQKVVSKSLISKLPKFYYNWGKDDTNIW